MNIKLRAFTDVLSMVVGVAVVAYLYTLAPMEIATIVGISTVLWILYMFYQIRVIQLEVDQRKEQKEEQ